MESTLTKLELQPAPIYQYFDALNAGNYEAVSQLFALDGQLHPPFESAIVGREAIATYLVAETKDMKLEPKQTHLEQQTDGFVKVQIQGKVQTPIFGVNVGWDFLINSDGEISRVEVKLLAALQDLLAFKR